MSTSRPAARRSRWMLVLPILALSLVVSAQTRPLRLVSTAWPPFTNAPGTPRFALDLVETALGRIPVSSNTAIISAADFTTALLSGPFDGSAAVWKDPQREQVLLFSQPYLENRLVLIGRRGADVSAKTLSALAGKRVAIVEGYSYGDAIERSGAVFTRSRSEEDSLSELLKGRVDFTLMDDLVVQTIVSAYPKESAERLQIGVTPLVSRPLHLAIRRTHPDAETIIARFNAQLRGMIADRTYHQLLHVDWIRADVDGDGVSEYVPATDNAGRQIPQRVYALFTSSDPTATPPARFYLGGTIYADWASVPEAYRNLDSQHPDPSRSTASIFKITW